MDKIEELKEEIHDWKKGFPKVAYNEYNDGYVDALCAVEDMIDKIFGGEM